MPPVDLIDETYVVAHPAALAARLRQADGWLAGLELTVFQDRGDSGVRWTVTGALVGTAEIWLEPNRDGTIVHFYLRAEPTRRGSTTEPIGGSTRHQRRVADRLRRRYTGEVKRAINAFKDELEATRPVGMPLGATDLSHLLRESVREPVKEGPLPADQ